jgi:broad specificity phosphatase PhoE
MKHTPLRLFLVRHGNTFEKHQTPVQVGAQTDLPLTDQGRKQALAFGALLSQNKIVPRAIYAGALKRQRETGTLLVEQLGLEEKQLKHANALTELDYGLWEGLEAATISEGWPEEYAAWTEQAKWPAHIFGGAQERHLAEIGRWLQELRQSYAPGDALVGVTSNGVIRYFYSLMEQAWRACIAQKRMEELKVKTGHYCELLLYPDSIEVQSWNSNPATQ